MHVDWRRDVLFPSLLESVVFKASAYVYSHFYPDYSSDRLSMLMAKRVHAGVIVHFSTLLESLKMRFRTWMEIESIYLHEHSMDLLIPMLGKTDVLFAVTGDELMYCVFMLPNSAVIEVRLDSRPASEYQSVAVSTELEYLSLPSSEVCAGKGKCTKRSKLQKNCTVEYAECEKKVAQALTIVKGKKYV